MARPRRQRKQFRIETIKTTHGKLAAVLYAVGSDDFVMVDDEALAAIGRDASRVAAILRRENGRGRIFLPTGPLARLGLPEVSNGS